MKFVAVAFYVAFVLAIGVDSASVSLSSSQLTLNGNAHIQFYGPKEEIWAGLSNGHRYPIINSGDLIALRSAYSSGSYSKYWMKCKTSRCYWTTCKGTSMTSAAWSSCSSKMLFYIHAMGKMDGQPINSGDTVSISSKAYGTRYRLYCGTSTGSKCYMKSGLLVEGALTTAQSLLSTAPWDPRYIPAQNNRVKTPNLSSCSSRMIFRITAMGKMDGQPINSGDIVTFTAKQYGYTSSYHLRCDTSSSYKCRMVSTTSSMTGNSWLSYIYTTFIIYSRNAVDGRPVQYGDIVGFKYPFGSSSTWLYRSGSYFYSKSCSSNNKWSCARANTITGFQIFKKL